MSDLWWLGEIVLLCWGMMAVVTMMGELYWKDGKERHVQCQGYLRDATELTWAPDAPNPSRARVMLKYK